MQYIILTAGDAPSLTARVREFIATGWQPHGGVAASRSSGIELLAQAMTRSGIRLPPRKDEPLKQS